MASVTGTTNIFTNPRSLLLVRAAWILLVFLSTIILLVSLPYRLQEMPLRVAMAFSPAEQGAATVHALVLVSTWSDFLVSALAVVLGLLIFLRRAESRVAIILSLALTVGVAHLTGSTMHFARANMAWVVPVSIVWLAMMLSLYLFLFTFPDGHFYPHYARWLIPLFMIWEVFRMVLGLVTVTLVPESFLVTGLLVLLGLMAQVRRYRRQASIMQRQQTKWMVFGLSLAVFGFLADYVLFVILPHLLSGDVLAVTLILVEVLLARLGVAAFIVATTLAILRYRLWDIDLAINRSLVYGSATVVLAALFVGGALLLQAVVGKDSGSLAFAVAAVVTGALFNPVRRRAQRFIDRRLYRFRFDLNELARGENRPEIKTPGLHTGRLLGAYEVLGVIGRGGMGEVYKGYDGEKTVALKILPDNLAQQDTFRARFVREAQMMAALNHPHIVHVFGAGECDGIHYLAMEYVDGRDLRDLVQAQAPLPLTEVREIVTGIAAALDYAHAQGYVHRDIKASNILLRPGTGGATWHPLITDFGVAKMKDAESSLTGTGAIGTIDYMAPEQIHAAREVDWRADIYALGIVFFEMLTGERPFQGDPAQVLFAHLQQPARDPAVLRPDLPPAFSMTALRALMKAPEDRFDSAGALAAELA